MARGHFWQYILNEEGQPIADAEVNVYLTGSNVPAYVFTQESGGTATNTNPQVTSNDEGYFEFWIGNPTELSGYSSTQKFAISWSKPGIITTGRVDNIECYSPPIETFVVDITSTDTVKNKTVSNALAKSWSDNLVRSLTFDIPSGSWSAETSASYGLPAMSYIHTQSSPSSAWGITLLERFDDAVVYSVFCTNAGSPPVDLPFTSISFTSPTQITINFAAPSSGYAVITGGNWGAYFYDLTHNRNTRTPIIQIWNSDTNTLANVRIQSTTLNDVRIWIGSLSNTVAVVYA